VCVLRKQRAMSDKEQDFMPLVTGQLSSRVEVSVWKDDLTRHKVDAVVNAANEKLNHGGGLAQALSECGGPMIQKWSDDIIQKCGRVKTGEAVLTPAGKLPCRYIIHAVGPKVSQNPSKKEVKGAAPLLTNTVISILQTVVSQNITSVAIPALSSGLFNFPRDYAVAEFAKQNTKKLDVNLVVFPKDNEMMEVIYANYILCFSVFEPSFSIFILIMFYFHPPHKYLVQHSF
uniref:Macro domain-containing protein n=1 Tax=Sinocyclocheilus anshuiensis TaxID=1608454 RepID=A0A671SSI2_9TELE